MMKLLDARWRDADLGQQPVFPPSQALQKLQKHLRLPAWVCAAAVGLAACSDDAVQDASSVVALFDAVLQACGQPLAADGAFNPQAITAAGWRLSRRTVRNNAEERQADLGSVPILTKPEYEESSWLHTAHERPLAVIRWPASTRVIPDVCRATARVKSAQEVPRLVLGITGKVAVAMSHEELVTGGGDFLTRLSSPIRQTRYHWQTPAYRIALTVGDAGAVELAIEAAPLPGALKPGLDAPQRHPATAGNEKPARMGVVQEAPPR